MTAISLKMFEAIFKANNVGEVRVVSALALAAQSHLLLNAAETDRYLKLAYDASTNEDVWHSIQECKRMLDKVYHSGQYALTTK